MDSFKISAKDQNAVQQKLKGTNEWSKIQNTNQKLKTTKRGKQTKIEARAEFAKQKRQLQRESNDKKEVEERKQAALEEKENWEGEFFGKKKGRKFKQRQREVRDFKENVDDIVDEEIYREKATRTVY